MTDNNLQEKLRQQGLVIVEEEINFLRNSLLNKENIVICGETGSGKTTLTTVILEELSYNKILVITEEPEKYPYNSELITHEEVETEDIIYNELRNEISIVVIDDCQEEDIKEAVKLMDDRLGCLLTFTDKDCELARKLIYETISNDEEINGYFRPITFIEMNRKQNPVRGYQIVL